MGGTGLYVEALCSALLAQGHAVAVVHPEVTAAPLLREERTAWGLRVALGGPAPRRWEETWRDPAREGIWRRWLRGWKADVVHVHHLSGLPLGLLRVSRSLGVRLVVTLHDYALPCARGQLVDRWLRPCEGPSAERCALCLGEHLRLDPVKARLATALSRWPTVPEGIRGRYAATTPPPRPQEQARVQGRLEAVRQALLGVDRLLAPSRHLADRFEAMGMGMSGGGGVGVEVCDLPLLRPISASSVAGAGPVRLLFASSILPTKGPHLLLEAYRSLPAGAATLTFAGPSPPFDGHPRYAAQLRADAEATAGVHWRGALSAEAVPDLLAGHDVLVLPSLWPENSPLIVREATAAGLPVVASAEGGVAELAPHARLVAAGDVQALSEALRAEVALGRRRLPPAAWPSPAAHAAWLVQSVYAPPA